MTGPDAAVIEWLAAHRFAAGDRLALGVMAVGAPAVTLAAAALVVVGYVVVFRAYRLPASVLLSVVGATAAAGPLKDLIGRPRPPSGLALVQATGLSMPSTAAALTAAGATALALGVAALHPRWGRSVVAVGALGAAVVGLSVVYLGAHWPTDVLAGWALGAAIGASCAALITPRPPRAEPTVGEVRLRPPSSLTP